MLSEREHFKVGFISRCIEEGFTTPEQIGGQVKLAMAQLEGTEKQGQIPILSDLIRGAGNIGSSMLSFGIPLALAAPPILGATAGYAAARATDIDDTDVEEQKRQELIDELKQQSAKVRRMRGLSGMKSRASGVEML